MRQIKARAYRKMQTLVWQFKDKEASEKAKCERERERGEIVRCC